MTLAEGDTAWGFLAFESLCMAKIGYLQESFFHRSAEVEIHFWC